jgi:hypothetical protein
LKKSAKPSGSADQASAGIVSMIALKFRASFFAPQERLEDAA